MGTPILIMGKSGTGKSTSLRNFSKGEVAIINVLGKLLPFESDIKTYDTDNYNKILEAIDKTQRKIIIIDDAGYLMTNQFMRDRRNYSNTYEFYDDSAIAFWKLIDFARVRTPKDKTIYIIMHEEQDDFGNIKPKTIGRLLDQKVCIEGNFSIVLRSKKTDDQYVFQTQTSGLDVAKTPLGMFKDVNIDNDLKIVDDRIRAFYKLNITEEETK